MTRFLSSNSLLFAALAPAALLFSVSCGGSDQAATTDGQAASTHADRGHADDLAAANHAETSGHDDHAHDDHAHDGEAEQEVDMKAKAAEMNAAREALNDAHAGHDHGPGEHGVEGPPPIVVNEEMIASGDGPRVTYEIGRDSVDFGRVTQGAVLHHTYDLQSAGNQDLIITQIKPTCGCTVAKLLVENEAGEMVEYVYGDPIKPGSKMELPAKMHTKNKRGNQTVRINVFSNDPRATMQLGMTASIDPFFNINPGFLTFGKISVGEEVIKTASISTAKGQPMMLTILEHTQPAGARVTLEPKNPDADGRSRSWELTVALGPDLPEGNLARQLQLVSDIEIEGQELREGDVSEKYQASVTVSAEVVGPFTYTPAYLSMGLVRPGELRTRSVRIDGHDANYLLSEHTPSLRIVGLPVPNEPGAYEDWDLAEFFVAEVKPVEGQNAIDVELRLEGLPEDKRGSFGGMLVVDMDHPTKKEIPLRITGVCRGGAK
ncbi:MAG: DUF1573 domain-containing protein [Planctomycetes bacterium]|nr:DUF1573 domain-containing protein [Planctomycetota bacterium]